MAAQVAKSESIFNEHFQELTAFKTFFDKEKDTIDYDNAKLRVKLLENLHEDMKINSMDLIVALKENEDEKKKVRARIAKFTSSFATIHSAFARLVRKRDEYNEEQKAKLAKENLPASQPRAVKIKPIEPPDFDGSVDHWTSYRDVFESIIHTNANLEPIQKFHYLRQSMKLPSGLANVLDTFPFTADNYEAAWTAVKKRYNDKRKIIASHLNSMFTAKKMSNGSSSELRKVIDVYASNLSALKQQGLDIEAKDDLINAVIVHTIIDRLDDDTLKDWRKHHKEDTASWCKLQEFLEAQERSLDDRQLARKVLTKSSDSSSRNSKTLSSSISSNAAKETSSQHQRVCCLCQQQHSIWSCPRFINMSTSERCKFAQDNSLCFNCLSKGHLRRDCTSQYKCKTCRKDHHSLLHQDSRNSSVDSFPRAQCSSEVAPKATQASSSSKEDQQKVFHPQSMVKKTTDTSAATATEYSTANAVTTTTMVSTSHTFLPTILLEVADLEGTFYTCRALLDTGSDTNLIQTDLAKKLRLKLDSSASTLFSVNNQSTKIKYKTEAIIRSRHQHYERKLLFSLLDDVTSYIPARTIDISRFNIPDKHQLADPQFNEATAVEMLLSADIFFDCLLSENIRLPDGPMLFATKFGFVVGGAVEIFKSTISNHIVSSFIVSKRKTLSGIGEKLDKFIVNEDLPSTIPTPTSDEQYCELLHDNSNRHESGKIVVIKPKRENTNQLGKKFNNTYRMFHIQKKRRRHPLTKRQRRLLQKKKILQSDGKKLCKFISTHPSLLTQLPKDDLQIIDDDNTILQSKIFVKDQLGWKEFKKMFTCMNSVFISHRCVIDQHKIIELHALCCESNHAFIAVVYDEFSYDDSGRKQVLFLIAQSKVSSTNQKIIDRLELCAATLHSKFITFVVSISSVPINNNALWSDSTIVLSWMIIRTMKLSTFATNRNAVINELTNCYTWRNIRGRDNPAEVRYRERKPEKIKDSKLWYEPFDSSSSFNLSQSAWPEYCITSNEDDPEVTMELITTLLIQSHDHFSRFVDQRISKFTIIVCSYSTINRFIKTRLKLITSNLTDHFSTEKHNAIKIGQRNLFHEEYLFLSRQNQPHLSNEERKNQLFVINKSSCLLLSLWIDSDNMIRIGGRLSNFKQIYKDHQILLLYSNFTIALISHLHHKNCYAGQTALLSFNREKYLPLRAKFTVKRVKIETSTKCLYSGAFYLKWNSDTKTKAFIAAQTRFVTRRGIYTEISNNNVISFEGADNTLKKFIEHMTSKVAEQCTNLTTECRFTTLRPSEFQQKKEFHIGDMVLLFDKNLSTTTLLNDRIIQLFLPRRNNVVRNIEAKIQHRFNQSDVRYLCFYHYNLFLRYQHLNFIHRLSRIRRHSSPGSVFAAQTLFDIKQQYLTNFNSTDSF